MNGITSQRANEFNIPGQMPGESEEHFRNRVAAQLRAMGHVIEAHEALADALFDDPDGSAQIGILGAVAQSMAGHGFGAQTWGDQVGHDIAAGIHTGSKRTEGSGLLALLILMNQ